MNRPVFLSAIPLLTSSACRSKAFMAPHSLDTTKSPSAVLFSRAAVTTQWTSHAAVWFDAGPCVVANSLIISHGPEGIIFKYPGIVLHSTIVNLDHTSNSVGIETGNKWVYHDTTVADTAIFGFSHAGATTNAKTPYSPKSSNNVTDAPIGDSGNTTVDGRAGKLPGQDHSWHSLRCLDGFCICQSRQRLASKDWRPAHWQGICFRALQHLL